MHGGVHGIFGVPVNMDPGNQGKEAWARKGKVTSRGRESGIGSLAGREIALAIPPMGDGPEVRPAVLDKVDNSWNIIQISIDVSEDEARQRRQNIEFFTTGEEDTVSAGGGIVVFMPKSPPIDVDTIERAGPNRVAERYAATARGEGFGVGGGPRGRVVNGAWVSHGGSNTG